MLVTRKKWRIEQRHDIIAAARLTGWKNLPCMAHTLNLIVQESIEEIEDLALLRRKCHSYLLQAEF